jgi:hypothetical protein
VALTAEMPYPGLAALLPTAGAVALLYGGAAPSGPMRLLAAAPLRFLGKISYSLYLWHWPLLVLPLMFLERALTGVEIVASVAVAIGVSWLSWRFVEQPFRYGDRTRRATSWSAIRVGVAGILSVALFTQGLAAALPSSAVAVQPTPSPSGSPVASDGPITLPADLTPTLASARDDEERLRGDGDAPLVTGDDDVRFAAVLGEFVGVVADLCGAVDLPFVAAVPGLDARSLDVVLGAVGGMTRARLGDALVLFSVAVRTAALARGFDASCVVVDDVADGGAVCAVDGRLEERL